jgi:prepilin-type N-terminal cleavage/methylation domain-containing protein
MNQRAFSLIELIGVLAILAMLTALLLPRLSGKHQSAPDVIRTMNEAHITEAMIAVQSIEPIINTHIAQFGSLGSFNGAPAASGTYDNFSQILIKEGVLERPFGVSLGSSSFLRLIGTSGLTATTPVDGLNGAYDLDGDGKNDVVGAAFVVEAVILGVKEAEAMALNDRLDGPRLAAINGGDDLLGRVIYRKAGADGLTEVHVHIMHK